MQKKIKWTKQQATAIKKSYQHWLRLSLGIEKPRETMGGDSCALCKLCSFPGALYDTDCDLCPIVLGGHPPCVDGLWTDVRMWRRPMRDMAAFLAKLYRMGVE